jgi:hypothetical protein
MTAGNPSDPAGSLERLSMLAFAVVGTVGIVFNLLMYVLFAAGARQAGLTFGWLNDLAVLLQFALAVRSGGTNGPTEPNGRTRTLRPSVAGLLVATGVVIDAEDRDRRW